MTSPAAGALHAEVTAGPYWGNSTCQPVRTWSPAPGVVLYDTARPSANVTPEVTFSFTPPQCGQCTEQATCVYSYGAGGFAACNAHDPTRQPAWLAMAAPAFFHYRSLGYPMAAPHATGHLGMRLPS